MNRWSLALTALLGACGLAAAQPAQPRAADASGNGPLRVDVQPGPNPWTHLNIEEDPDLFHFAIVSDNTGRARAGVFRDAMVKLNWMRPKFVLSIGDFIQGHNQVEPLQRQWDAFLKDLSVLELPFFFVPGNHDISNPTMRKVYTERIGRPYYHFVYRGVLFLCVDVQDGTQRRISPQQLEYFRHALAEHAAVRWTFVFMHKPAWWMETELDAPFEGWDALEAMLQGRPYTVFSGHVHRYLKQVRHGREYYTLATTGGASGQRGPEMGEFDHFTWVTMGRGGPIISNVDLKGVLPTDLRTEADMDIADRGKDILAGRQTLRFDGSHLDQPLKGTLHFTHGVRLPATISLSFDQHPQLRVEPRSIERDLTPAAGNYANNQPQKLAVPFQVIPMRFAAAEDIPPLKVNGTITYTLPDGRSVRQPLEQTIHLERNWLLEPGAIAVDGDVDEWQALRLGGIPREVSGDAGRWTGPDDAGFTFDVRRDDAFVYVAVAATDDRLIAAADGQGDGLDLWIDARPMPQRWVGNKWQQGLFANFIRISLMPGADGAVGVVDSDRLPTGVRVSGRVGETGWQAEVAIPAGYFEKMQGADWNSLRLNVILQDVDAAGDKPASIAWMPDWRWQHNIPQSGTFILTSR